MKEVNLNRLELRIK